MERVALRVFGVFLIIVGLILVVASLLQSVPASPVSGGVVVLIGPLPLSFGFGPYGLQMLVIALSLALLMMAILFILFAWSRRNAQWSRSGASRTFTKGFEPATNGSLRSRANSSPCGSKALVSPGARRSTWLSHSPTAIPLRANK